MTDDALFIQVNSVTKSFGNIIAVNGVSLNLPAGRTVALLGPNGSGKTTLFRMISSMLTPDTGSIQIGGLDSERDRLAYRRQLGVVFQSPSLDKKLTAAENLRHFGHLYGLSGLSLEERIKEMLKRLEVADRANDRVETLSGGLARRVEIAKCLLTDPAVLLMDEPSTGLDPSARRNLWNLVHRLCREQGVTVLLTTHFLDEADRCDLVAIINRGELLALDAPAQLRMRLGNEVIIIEAHLPADAARILSQEFSLSFKQIDNSLHVETDQPIQRLAELAKRLAGLVQSITLTQPTLEDVFIRLTGHRFDP